MNPRDPIVIDPHGFTAEQGWAICRQAVKDAGGDVVGEDGEPNWRAAFSADPGICYCPICKAQYWAFGRIIACADCGAHFPTDWWPMYS